MSNIITDGSGNSYRAKVDSTNRLYTRTVTETELDEAVKEGNGFNINTGVITLTNDTTTPVLYMKNNEDEDLNIDAMIVGLGTSTGGSATEMATITLLRNPTAGTIVSGATSVDVISNRNFGSTATLVVDAYKGATGLTMTDGTEHIISYQSDFGRTFYTLNEVIPRNSSLGVKIAPPTGNTSLPMYVALVCHKHGG